MNLLGKSIPVLCYHKVSYNGGQTPENFESHLQFLQEKKFTTINSEQLYNFMKSNTPLPSNPIVLTFDDCALDNWVYAIPLLNKYNFKGVFFAITDFIKDGEIRPQMGEKNIPEITDAEDAFVQVFSNNDYSQFMNKSEIYKTVHTYGHEISSHTTSHSMTFNNLKIRAVYPEGWHWGIYGIYNEVKDGTVYYEKGSAYTYDGFWPEYDQNNNFRFIKRSKQERYNFCIKELTESRKILEDILQKPIDFFCWPWGDFDKLGIKAAKEVGYKGSYTLERGANVTGGDPFKIYRLAIADHKSLKWLKTRMKMYGNKTGATIFKKKFKKKYEFNNILIFAGSDNQYEKQCQQSLIQQLAKIKLDITIICSSDDTDYFKEFIPANKVIKFKNLVQENLTDFDIIHIMTQNNLTDITTLIHSSHNIPKIIVDFVNDSDISKIKKFDAIICSSNDEINQLQSSGVKKEIIQLLPPSDQITSFDPEYKRTEQLITIYSNA